MTEFMDFIAISGLRFNEAVSSYNLIIESAANGKLEDYYDSEGQLLAHFKFKELFIHRTKKTFISYIPEDLIIRIGGKEKLSTFQIYNAHKRKTLSKSRFGDVREYYATFITKFLNPAEIDFLQGRISASVFMRNYFNPVLIGDLKKRVFAGILELEGKFTFEVTMLREIYDKADSKRALYVLGSPREIYLKFNKIFVLISV